MTETFYGGFISFVLTSITRSLDVIYWCHKTIVTKMVSQGQQNLGNSLVGRSRMFIYEVSHSLVLKNKIKLKRKKIKGWFLRREGMKITNGFLAER